MDKFKINKSLNLSGDITVSSSKNATLPIIAATILFPFEVKLKEVAKLKDVNTFLELLADLGTTISKGEVISINNETINKHEAEYELVRKMRASVLVLGPLLARFHEAIVSLPGGCAIGTRPVDIHLSALEKMGATIEIENGYIKAKCSGLTGAKIVFPFPSVGATENILTAAVYAVGETIIENAAMEPEIDDLVDFLMAHGIEIEGRGTNILKINGTTPDKIKPMSEAYKIIPDRIEAATYIIGALMTGSEVTVQNVVADHLDAVLNRLKDMGAKLEIGDDFVKVFKSENLKSVNIETQPYPGFPTDVQAQIMALATQCSGTSIITENIFENRFMHVPELVRMGAKISLKGKSAIIEGPAKLKGAPVMCTDLRASAALVLAGLVADGETEIRRVYHIDRGYQQIDSKLAGIGAKIKRGDQ